MKAFFLLSGENYLLARDEILFLLGIKTYSSPDKCALIADINDNILKSISRLAYTKKVYKLLFSSDIKSLEDSMRKFSWDTVYKKDFCLRIKSLDKKNKEHGLEEKSLAGFIWKAVKKPKVNLDNPATLIELIFSGKKVFCCLLIYEQKENFEERKAHKRPALHPVSLHPKLARCLVNLTGTKTTDEVVDTFCGTGGILIEAGLMKIKSTGYDIDKNILDKCRKNIGFFRIKNCRLIYSDSLKLRRKCSYVVTDLPYGRNTKDIDADKLYSYFLNNLRLILVKRAVVVFPDDVNYKKLVKKAKLKISSEYSYYVHKTMTRKIVVLT